MTFNDLVLFIMRRDGLSPHVAIAHALTISKKDRRRIKKSILKGEASVQV